MHRMTKELHETTKPRFRVVAAGMHSAPCGKDFALHAHRCWEIVYYREGRIEMVIGGTPYACSPGAVLITPPGIAHTERALTDYANYYVSIEADGAPSWPVVCHDDARNGIGQVMARIVAESHGSASEGAVMLDLLTRQLDILIRRAAAHSKISRSESLVRQAEQIFEHEFSGPIQIRSIARRLSVSEATLRSCFRQTRGSSPLQSLHAIRLRVAAELLSLGDLKLDAVADMCGYHSASHMTRYFKRLRRQTPGGLRRAAGNVQLADPGVKTRRKRRG